MRSVPGSFWDFPAPRSSSGLAGRVTLPLCSEVLASTDHPIRFSPVVGARCRPPMSKITLLHPFMGKTVRIIRNPTAHCKQGGNKNEIENMVRTKSSGCHIVWQWEDRSDLSSHLETMVRILRAQIAPLIFGIGRRKRRLAP